MEEFELWIARNERPMWDTLPREELMLLAWQACATIKDKRIAELGLIISGKTFYDIRQQTIGQCLDIVSDPSLRDFDSWDTVNNIAAAIRKLKGE